MNRRNFISYSSIALGGATVLRQNLDVTTISGNAKYFFAKSGIAGNSNDACFGILKTSDYDNDNDWLLRARNDFGFRSELRYSNNDKFKVPFAKALLDYFISRDSLSFACASISRTTFNNGIENSSNQISRLQKGNIKANYIHQLLGELEPETNQVVIMKSEYSFGSGNQFHRFFEHNTAITTVDKIYFEEDLLQLSSLITGCIKADLQQSSLNAVNTQILNHLKGALGIESFTELNNDKIKII